MQGPPHPPPSEPAGLASRALSAHNTSQHFTTPHNTSQHLTTPHFSSLQLTSAHFTSRHHTTPTLIRTRVLWVRIDIFTFSLFFTFSSLFFSFLFSSHHFCSQDAPRPPPDPSKKWSKNLLLTPFPSSLDRPFRQGGSGPSQDAPKSAPEPPKTRPRAAQDAPRWPKTPPRPHQDGPRPSQDRPETSQDRPQTPQIPSRGP